MAELQKSRWGQTTHPQQGQYRPRGGQLVLGGGAKTFYDFTMIYGPQRATVWIYSVSPGLRLQRRAMIREKV